MNGYQTGFLKDNDGTLLKESLTYGKIMAGANYQSEDGLRSFTVTPVLVPPKEVHYTERYCKNSLSICNIKGICLFLPF
jgi:hypothetical protein